MTHTIANNDLAAPAPESSEGLGKLLAVLDLGRPSCPDPEIERLLRAMESQVVERLSAPATSFSGLTLLEAKHQLNKLSPTDSPDLVVTLVIQKRKPAIDPVEADPREIPEGSGSCDSSSATVLPAIPGAHVVAQYLRQYGERTPAQGDGLPAGHDEPFALIPLSLADAILNWSGAEPSQSVLAQSVDAWRRRRPAQGSANTYCQPHREDAEPHRLPCAAQVGSVRFEKGATLQSLIDHANALHLRAQIGASTSVDEAGRAAGFTSP